MQNQQPTNTEQKVKQIKDYVSSVGYLTKVKSRFDLPTWQFCKDLKNVASLYLKQDFIDEYNNLVLALESEGLLKVEESKDNKHANGILKTSELSEELLYGMPEEDLAFFKRKRIELPMPLTLNEPLHQNPLVLNGGMEFETYVAASYLMKKHNALSRGIEFKLTLSDMKRLLKTKYCKYSGVLLTLEGDSKLTLERIDNTIGYTKENTIAVSSAANVLKNRLLESKELTKGFNAKELQKLLLSFAELCN